MPHKLFFEALFGVLILIALVPFLVAFGRWVEPRVAPVVTLAEFTEQPNGRYTVTFEKLRDCELIGVYWFTGATWVRQKFDNQFTRPRGEGVSAGWALPPGVSTSEHIAVARHRCNPLWETQTPFYNP